MHLLFLHSNGGGIENSHLILNINACDIGNVDCLDWRGFHNQNRVL